MTTITPAKAIELLEEAVAERGADYVDPLGVTDSTCKYVSNGEPGCIIGMALHKYGLSIDDIIRVDFEGSEIDSVDTVDVLQKLGVEVEPDALHTWRTAQELQDKGSTWGQALEAAKTVSSVEA